MICGYKEYKVKLKMVQEQCLQLKMKFFVGKMDLWWWGSLLGGGRFFQVGERHQLSGLRGDFPSIPCSKEISSDGGGKVNK